MTAASTGIKAVVRAAGAICMLLTAVMPAASAASQCSARDWLDNIEQRLVALSGYPIQVRSESGDESVSELHGTYAVFYAPLSVIWLLDDVQEDQSSADWNIVSGQILREDTPDGGIIRFEWHDGIDFEYRWPEPFPELRAGRERHILAIKHDRLLASELARPVAGLPVGSRFDTDGVVRPHSDQSDEASVTFWRSEGTAIRLHRSDGTLELVDIDDLLLALEPEEDH